MLLPSDAKGRTRLLPASIPFRFFAAAAVFHLLGWTLVALAPERVLAHAGGTGPGLAALHAFTLGTLAMTAIGASLQLLPVATVQPARWVRASAGIWWVFVPGVLLMVVALALDASGAAAVGAAMAAAAMAVHAALLGTHLARAKRQRALTMYGWAALLGLVATICIGPALALRLRYGAPALGAGAVGAHLIAACYGFLGMLSVGFGYLLVPMFMVSRAPGESSQRAMLAVLGVAVCIALTAALADAPPGWFVAAGSLGFAGTCAHAMQMFRVVARRRGREPGGSVALLRLAWIALPAGVAVGVLGALSMQHGAARDIASLAWMLPDQAPWATFVVLLVPGWLLSFVLAILLRIVPFLASVHAKIRYGSMPPVSALAPVLTARIVVVGHAAALAAMLGGVALHRVELVAASGWAGVCAALALLSFMGVVAQRAGCPPRSPSGAQ